MPKVDSYRPKINTKIDSQILNLTPTGLNLSPNAKIRLSKPKIDSQRPKFNSQRLKCTPKYPNQNRLPEVPEVQY